MFCQQIAALLGVECPQLSSIEKQLRAFCPNLPKMTESLSDGGSLVSSFAPKKAQVWVGGYNPADQDHNDADLHATVSVSFRNPKMFAAFEASILDTKKQLGATWHFDSDTDVATLKY
jgi:hypothetical protein